MKTSISDTMRPLLDSQFRYGLIAYFAGSYREVISLSRLSYPKRLSSWTRAVASKWRQLQITLNHCQNLTRFTNTLLQLWSHTVFQLEEYNL